MYAVLGRPPRGFAAQAEVDALKEELAKARAASGEVAADLESLFLAARESARVALKEANKAHAEAAASEARATRTAAALEQANRTVLGKSLCIPPTLGVSL